MPDLNAALRLFVSRPGFCAAVVLTLAIGLGSVTAIVSVAHALLLRPLPFPESHRIVTIEPRVAGAPGKLARREFRELERQPGTFASIGLYVMTQYNLTGGGPPQALLAWRRR
jgi:hypothetical protein